MAKAAQTKPLSRLALLAATVLCCCIPFLSPAHAQANDGDALVYDVYSISAEVEADVSNDLMTVNMVVQAQGKESAQLANDINATMGWALARLQAFRSIESETRDYQTQPRYERNGSRIIGWNATQRLQLKTENFEEAGDAIQTLQERLQVQGIQMSAKPATRKKAEDQLINQALEAFKRRALLVQTNMGAPDYQIVNVNINTGGSRGHMMDAPRMRSSASSLSVESAPAIAAGTSRVFVSIQGRIQLD